MAKEWGVYYVVRTENGRVRDPVKVTTRRTKKEAQEEADRQNRLNGGYDELTSSYKKYFVA